MDFKRQPRQPEQPQYPQQPSAQPVQGNYEPDQPVYTDRQFSSGVPQGPSVQPGQINVDTSIQQKTPKKRTNKPLLIILSSVVVLVVIVLAVVGWYFFSLRPVDAQAQPKDFEVVSGSTPSMIGEGLQQSGIIRSSKAFLINTRLQGAQGSLQAGVYSLSPADSTDEIISKLADGPDKTSVDITFLPGATIADHKKVLIDAGYSEDQVDQALSRPYNHPLFTTKPTGTDLEGYMYGETHRFDKGTPLDVVLKRYFDDYYQVIEQNKLISGFQKHGLSLFEGITLASIIEREVSCGDSQVCEDQRKVAQVFFKRLDEGMSLGADATFIYAAKKEGKKPTVNFDSPYNTRVHRGLPPGPISSPGLGALLAVADPAEGDYLYFVSGDDDINYFSRTEAEHIDMTKKHCRIKCQLP